MTVGQTHIDLDVLQRYKSEGLLRVQTHPNLPLSIWNYSNKCQLYRKWDNITTVCRGLIVSNIDGKIVGRSFDKFSSEKDCLHQSTPNYHVFEKLDGSMGVLFNYNDQWIFTSRGSFTSEQALKGQQLLETRVPEYKSILDPTISYVFEIIYPDNSIVINYGEDERLVLLAAYQQPDHQEAKWIEIYPLPENIPFETVQMIATKPLKELLALDTPNQEGFVIRFENGARIKIKFESYLVLHKSRNNINADTIYELFMLGKTCQDHLLNVPIQFYDQVQQLWEDLEYRHTQLLQALQEEFVNQQATNKTQREFALAIKDHPLKSALFQLRKGNLESVKAIIKHLLKPSSQQSN